ncbi:hypothetical protein ACFPZL_14035, partial [Leucobacter soli]
AGDLILRRALGARTDRETRGIAEPWRPFRGYATQHLWADFLAARASVGIAAKAAGGTPTATATETAGTTATAGTGTATRSGTATTGHATAIAPDTKDPS